MDTRSTGGSPVFLCEDTGEPPVLPIARPGKTLREVSLRADADEVAAGFGGEAALDVGEVVLLDEADLEADVDPGGVGGALEVGELHPRLAAVEPCRQRVGAAGGEGVRTVT